MKKVGLVVLFSWLYAMALAQVKYDYNWCFGYKCGINFKNLSSPTTFYDSCNNLQGTASLSDSTGNLIFYVAPDSTIRNGNSGIISNGDSIDVDVNNITNALLFLPVPGYQDSLFYLFQLGSFFLPVCEANCYNIIYNIIKKEKLNTYSVIDKNQLLFNGAVEENLATARHANGRDWWLITHESNDATGSPATNRFYKWLITSEGIQLVDSQDIGTLHLYNSQSNEIVFSKQGQQMTCGTFRDSVCDIFDFDRCTGLLSNWRSLSGFSSYSEEFSADGSKLYVSSSLPEGSGGLYQFNLLDTDIMASMYPVYVDTIIWDGQFGQLQRGPDGKIYFSFYSEWAGDTLNEQPYHSLGVINQPDSLGASCMFKPFSFFLGDSAVTLLGLPNMPNYNLGPTSIYQSTISNDTFICTNIDTPTKGVFISVDTAPGVTVTWQAALGIVNINATRQLVDPIQSTWYYVTFSDTTILGGCQSRTDSVYVEVKLCDTLSIQQINEIAQHLRIYPNPAQNTAVIEWQPLKEELQLSVSDLLGREINFFKVDGMSGKTEMDISGLANGLYVVRLLSSAGGGGSVKLTVIK